MNNILFRKGLMIGIVLLMMGISSASFGSGIILDPVQPRYRGCTRIMYRRVFRTTGTQNGV